MPIIAARVDARLLHGIVATQWTPTYRPQRVMVIDDEFAGDPTRKAAMRMAKPADVALSVISEETARTNFRAGKYDGHTVFVIVRDPQIIADLIADGQQVPRLVLGLTYQPDDPDDAIAVSARAYIKRSELDAYRAIAQSGTELTAQYVPADTPEPLAPYLV